MYAEVIVDIASEMVDRVFEYKIQEGMEIQVGHRVSVPFGRMVKEGYVLKIKETPAYDARKIKEIIKPLEDYPALLPALLSLAFYIKERTNCPLCEALRLMIPAQMREGRIKVKTETVVQSLLSKEAHKAYLETVSKRSIKKRTILNILSDLQAHLLEDIKMFVDAPLPVLRALQEEKVVALTEREKLRVPPIQPYQLEESKKLTEQQQEVFEELKSALLKVKNVPYIERTKSLMSKRNFAFLLYGVTGSGKTEVFMNLAHACLDKGYGVIVLVPEIALTPQMTDWFYRRFGRVSAVLHSRLTAGEKFDEWRRIRRGDAKIVIGARSAVFAPIQNLGAIIVDEEHEQSYYSDHFPQYDAREIACHRAEKEGALFLLASATPSVTSFAMARRGDYTLLQMKERVNNRPLPDVSIVDMRNELRLGNRSIFSNELKARLAECIEKNQQAMLFINRRGFSPSVSCRMCGHVVKCPHCDVAMTYHMVDQKLHCHYCGNQMPMIEICPECLSKSIRTMGTGTQKVEEELKKLFPSVSTIRMDLDTTKQRNSMYELLNLFRQRKAQVLIGTQMIAKGLDFPSVTLVGAVMADLSLNLPDFRAPERTYQLLVQVAGRAGRADLKGHVVIQSYHPEHYAIQSAKAQDYISFFENEFERRKKDLYPPFTIIARFLIESAVEDDAQSATDMLYNDVETYLTNNNHLKKRVLFYRKDVAPIAFIQGKSRYHVLMKLLNHKDSEDILRDFQEMTRKDFKKGVRVLFEINPSTLI